MSGPSVGDRVGRYVLEAVLGEGGMGRVYRARDEALHRSVAVKIVIPGRLASEGVARLVREARAAAAFDHPNAVTVYDVGEDAGMAFLAMELVVGHTLRDYVGDPSVSRETRVRWLTDVARALAAAHRAGLVHRDIKPENVMVRDDGVVKVLDFGLARRTGAADARPALGTITGPGVVVGTPLYMSPEQLEGAALDGRTDQFAWGVMAYELMAGARPWEAKTTGSLVTEIMTKEPPPLAQRISGFVAVADVVTRALHKKPDVRWPSMDVLVAALEPAREAGRVSARELGEAPTEAAPITTAPRKRRGFGLALGFAAATIAGALVLTSHMRLPTVANILASPAAPVPTKITDLPPPVSTDPKALLALRAARQDYHDASIWRAAKEAVAATRLDPSLAAAAVLGLAWGASDSDILYSSARQYRASLSERDSALLTAVAPFYATIPRDKRAAASNLVELAARFPSDPEIQVIAASWLGQDGRLAEANVHIERTLKLDPTFAAALWVRAMFVREDVELMAALNACVAMSSTAASCIRSLAIHAQHQGHCDTMATQAERLVAIEPSFEASEMYRLNAVVSRGGPRSDAAPVLEALRSLPESARNEAPSFWPALVALHYGAFSEGIVLLGERPTKSAGLELGLAMLAAAEAGDTARATREARDYLAQRAAGLDGSAVVDAEATAIVIATDGHIPSTSRGLSDREEDPFAAFVERSGAAATSREAAALLAFDAVAAIRALPAVHRGVRLVATVGQTLARAGRAEDALPLLEQASGACAMVENDSVFIFERVAARMTLADVLAKKGDVPGACGWFAKVVEQWGSAKPRSLSAERARKRMSELHCP